MGQSCVGVATRALPAMYDRNHMRRSQADSKMFSIKLYLILPSTPRAKRSRISIFTLRHKPGDQQKSHPSLNSKPSIPSTLFRLRLAQSLQKQSQQCQFHTPIRKTTRDAADPAAQRLAFRGMIRSNSPCSMQCRASYMYIVSGPRLSAFKIPRPAKSPPSTLPTGCASGSDGPHRREEGPPSQTTDDDAASIRDTAS